MNQLAGTHHEYSTLMSGACKSVINEQLTRSDNFTKISVFPSSTDSRNISLVVGSE